MKSTNFDRMANLAALFLLGLFLVGSSGFEGLPNLGVFNGKRLLEIFTLLLLLLAVLAKRNLRTAFGELITALPKWVLAALSLSLLLGIISAARFSHPGYGLLEVGLLALLSLCLIATAAASRAGGKDFDRLAVLIVVAVGVTVTVTEAIGFFAALAANSEFSRSQMLIRFLHPRLYNQLQTFSIPLLAALPFIFNAGKKLKFAAVFLIAVQWCILIISGGRGTFVSVIAGLVAASFLFSSARRAWLPIQLAGLVLGIVMFMGLMTISQASLPGDGKLVEESVGRTMTSSNGRAYMWKVAWREALEQPLLGSGPASYGCDEPHWLNSHPHNFPMTILGEWGFPVFLMLMSIGLWLGWCLIMNIRRQTKGEESSDVLKSMLGCSILAGTLHAFVSGVLIMPASQAMVILVCGWALGKLKHEIHHGPGTSIAGTMALTAGVVLAAGISIFSITEIQQMNVRSKDLQNQNLYKPRYWHNGRSCKYFYESG